MGSVVIGQGCFQARLLCFGHNACLLEIHLLLHLAAGATALTCPGGSLTSAWFLALPASSSSFDPTSPSWLLSGKPLVLSGAAGKTLARLSRPVSSCVYFLGIVAAGTLGQSWTLGPGRASTAQAPGETILFSISSALR